MTDWEIVGEPVTLRIAVTNQPQRLHGVTRDHLTKGWVCVTWEPVDKSIPARPMTFSSVCGAYKDVEMVPCSPCPHGGRALCKRCEAVNAKGVSP